MQARSKGSPSQSLWTCLGEVLRNEGIAGLYKGLGPALILCSNPAIQFMVFDQLKHWWLAARSKRQSDEKEEIQHLSPTESLLIGAVYVEWGKVMILKWNSKLIDAQGENSGNSSHLSIHHGQSPITILR